MAVLLLAAAASRAQTLPSGFVSEPYLPTLSSYVAGFAFAPGDRVLIAEKRGIVRVAQGGTVLPTPFIDLTAEVRNYQDNGLTGIAVHPLFPTQPYVYLLYSYDPPGATVDVTGARVARLVRVTADAAAGYNVAVAGSLVVLMGRNSTLANSGNLTSVDDTAKVSCQSGPATSPGTYVEDCIPQDTGTHGVGTVTFGPDGKLYVGNGDSSNWAYVDPRAMRSQDLDSMAGKIFRIDPMTGAGLADNPFYNGNANANRSKVYAYGYRNPFRFTFQPGTGALFAADVGWNRWEELNVGGAANFGWPCFEGGSGSNLVNPDYAGAADTSARCAALPASSVRAAAWAYDHMGGGASLIAGEFYTGTAFPSQYRNALFVADYNLQWIKAVTPGAGGQVTVADFATAAGAVVQMTQGPDANLYYLLIGYPNSEIRRIRYTVGNRNPSAVVSADRTSGGAPLTVVFSSAGSTDPDGDTLTYSWDFGDSTTSTLANPSKTYSSPGTYSVRLTVSDGRGGTAQSTPLTITAGNSAPTVTIVSPAAGTRFRVGDTINLSATATDPEDGNVNASIRWQVILVHNTHSHPDAVPVPAGPTGSFVVPNHGQNISFQVCATATDQFGLTSTAVCVDLLPITVNYTFQSVPSGLALTFDSITYTTPFTVSPIANSTVQITAAPTQGAYAFVSWSDNGAASHTITIGATPQTLTATYRTTTPVNNPPVVTNPGSQAATVGSPVTLAIAASDPDGNTLTYSATGLPAGLTIAASSGVISGTPSAAGTFNSSVTVSDGQGGSASTSFTWAVTAAGSNGLSGEYYDGTSFNTFRFRRTDATVNFNWGAAGPGSGVNATQFSVRWTGRLEAPVSGEYTLCATSFDGMRIWVNNTLVADNVYTKSAATTSCGPFTAAQGTRYDLRVDYFNTGGSAAQAQLRWWYPGGTTEVIPARYLTPASGSSGSPPSISITSPANGTLFTATAVIPINTSASDPDGNLARVEFFNGATRIGQATAAPYNFIWNNVPAGQYSINVVATDTTGLTANASVTVLVQQPGGSGLSAVYYSDLGFTSRSFSRTDAKVDFDFASAGPGGGLNPNLYAVRWTGRLLAPTSEEFVLCTESDDGSAVWVNSQMVVNNYYDHVMTRACAPIVLTAGRLYDLRIDYYNSGGTGAVKLYWWYPSGQYEIIPSPYLSPFGGSSNSAPTVSIASPANGASFNAPASISITANASDPDGNLARVEFYNGSTRLGEDTTAPYQFTWSGVGAGNYTIVARAVDAAGLTATSQVSVSVVNATPVLVNSSDNRISYSGTWSNDTNVGYSGGLARVSSSAGSAATFTFTGTRIVIIGARTEVSGRFDVYVDNVFKATVDEFKSWPRTYRNRVWDSGTLTRGSHTLRVVVRSDRNPASLGRVVNIDALEYTP